MTRPLAPAVVEAMEKAAREMGRAETFRGYGPDYGYDFLIQAILDNDYKGLGIQADEVFVSDGAKCDVSNVQELFSDDAVVAVTDPVYPVYVDSNAMAGRAGNLRGRPLGPAGAICPARRRTASCRRCPTGRWT